MLVNIDNSFEKRERCKRNIITFIKRDICKRQEENLQEARGASF
jgi:hypothetical protein